MRLGCCRARHDCWVVTGSSGADESDWESLELEGEPEEELGVELEVEPEGELEAELGVELEVETAGDFAWLAFPSAGS